jgi:CubicO group peptidase (beta-lactamase class C family)
MAEYDVPVVGLGIIDQGEISYLNVFGELEEGTPAPDNTIFNVASITKTVITQLTLKLVEEGKWDLDEPLCHYWVDPDVANDPLHKKLTTYHVLTHQTGTTPPENSPLNLNPEPGFNIRVKDLNTSDMHWKTDLATPLKY